MLLQNIRTAFDALFNNRLRSFLTLLGVVIGVFAVTTTISMGAIATAGITDELQSFGSQSLFIVINQDDPLSPPLTDEDIDALSRLPIDILQQQSTQGVVRVDDKDVFLNINGTTANAIEVDRSLELARGRYFSEEEYRRGAPVIVKEISVSFNNGDSRQNYTVIGVKERISGALGSFANDTSGDIPLETFYLNFPFVNRGEYVFFPITIALDKNLDDVRAQVKSILDRRRGADSYSIQTIEGALTLFNTITTILQVVLGGIGAISLVVGGIGILNIMLVSVTERTREIGLRKALGAKKSTILQQFLIEAIVLTFIGGLIGVILSVGSLYLIVAVVPFVDRVIINPLVILLAFGVSVATGVIFGVWPASRAANLSPIEALRYE
jgi:putative ABC transport system permease protein